MLKKTAGIFFFVSVFLFFGLMGFSQARESPPIPKPVSPNATPIGQDMMSQEKALEILQNTFPEATKNKDFDIRFSQRIDSSSYWDLEWGQHTFGSGQSKTPHISASINTASGEIVSFIYSPGSAYYEGKDFIIDRDKALEIACAFLQEMHPDQVKKLELQYNNSYYFLQGDLKTSNYFRWNRVENGIPVRQDGISIGVDMISGQINNYTYNWTAIDLPPIGEVMPEAAVMDKVLDEIGICPVYKFPLLQYSYQSNTIASPIYMVNFNDKLNPLSILDLDAYSGEPLDICGKKVRAEDARRFHEDFAAVKTGAVEDAPYPDKVLEPEVAQKAAQDFFKFLGVSGEIEKSGGGSSGSHEYWGYSLVNEQPSSSKYEDIRVDIDAYTGKMVAFRRSHVSPGEENQKKKDIGFTQALEKARKMIEKVHPEKYRSLSLNATRQQDDNKEGTYDFSFARLVNGIPFENDGIKVSVDAYLGDILRYSLDWRPATFASLEKMISIEEAGDRLRTEQPLELTYTFPRNENYQLTGEALLVYHFSQIPWVDGLSGKMINLWEENEDVPEEANDISQHWAAPAISLIIENGLIKKEDIKPDEAVSRRNALRVLTAAADTHNHYVQEQKIQLYFTDIKEDDPDRRLFSQAVGRGLLINKDKLEPEKPLLREDLAVWLVNSLGYGELGTMEADIETPFKDAGQITAGKKNYVGLASGLGLLNADKNGHFRPQATVTWAEIATVALRLSPKIQTEQ